MAPEGGSGDVSEETSDVSSAPVPDDTERPMVERALHTRLRPGAEAAYDALHARVPEDLLRALAHAGVRDWRIWRDGRDVVHLVDVEDYRAMRDHLREHPANVAWQARVTPLQEVVDDYSGGDDGLPAVWSFAEQLAAADGTAPSSEGGR